MICSCYSKMKKKKKENNKTKKLTSCHHLLKESVFLLYDAVEISVMNSQMKRRGRFSTCKYLSFIECLCLKTCSGNRFNLNFPERFVLAFQWAWFVADSLIILPNICAAEIWCWFCFLLHFWVFYLLTKLSGQSQNEDAKWRRHKNI